MEQKQVLCLEQCSYREKKKFRGQFKIAAIYKKKKGKIEDRGTEEGRSQGTFSLIYQEDLYDKGKGVLKDN